MGSPEARPGYTGSRCTGPRCAEDLESFGDRLADFAASASVVVQGSDEYPANLAAVAGAPAVLFVRGSLVATDARAVSVVGTRRASPEGLAAARRLAGELAEAGVTVVSGLALGIDGASHAGALAAGGRTIAVLGSGLDQLYPREHTMLAADVARSGALVSQWWPWTPPAPAQFRRRNAVSSGLSLITVVVEASARSGARLQGRLAREQGRLLMLCAPVVNQEAWARSLVEAGSALMLRGADDVLEALDNSPAARPVVPGQSCQLSLDIG